MKGISRKGNFLVKRFISMILITAILGLYSPVNLHAAGSSLSHDVPGDTKVFTPLPEGYAPGTQEALTVTVTSTGENNTVTAAVYGTDADSFELVGTIGNLADQGTGTFTVRAKDGLPAGTYTAEVKIVSDEYTAGTSFALTQVVNVPPSSDATLKAASTIKGITVTSLGTPASAITGITMIGWAAIDTIQAADTTNTGSYITLFDKNDAGATVKAVKYPYGASPVNFETAPAYANQAIADNDFFIVKVTAEDGTTVNYYKVVVIVSLPRLAKVTNITLNAYAVASWTDVANESGYAVQLYKDGNPERDPIVISANSVDYEVSGLMQMAGAGSYTLRVTAKGDGTTYLDGLPSDISNAITQIAEVTQGLTWSGNVAHWSAVENADSYEVVLTKNGGYVLGSTRVVAAADASAGVDYTDLITSNGDGTYVYHVTAKGNQTTEANGRQSEGSNQNVISSQLVKVTNVTLNASGAANWADVTNESSYTVQLYKDGTTSGSPVSVAAGVTSYNFLAAMRAAGAGSYTVKVTAVGNGITYIDGPQSDASAAQTVIQPATVTAGLMWSGDVARWTTVSFAMSYDVQLYKNGTALGSPVNVTAANAASGVNFASVITAAGAGTYTYKVTAKGNATLILDAAASAASNNNVKVILSSDATLKATSTVKGVTVASLGTPKSTLGSAIIAGNVAISEAQAANTTNIGSYITLFEKNDPGATVKVVKYAEGASTADFTYDTAYANQAISNNDFFIVRVRAADGTQNYYKVVVAVPTTDATLKATSTIKGATITSLGTPNATLGSVVAGNVTINATQAANTTNTGSYITLFDKNYTGATVKAVKYASGASTANFETDAVYANEAISNNNFFIVKVTAANGTTVKYYKVVVTVDGTAPSYISGYPAAGQMQASGSSKVELLINVNESGTTYYVITRYLSQPTIEQVLAGRGSDNNPAIASGNVAVTANTEKSIIKYLPYYPLTYDAWIVTADAAGNATSVYKVSVTTPGGWASEEAKLHNLSRLKGKVLGTSGLGTPATSIAGITNPGRITLTIEQAMDISNGGTLFRATYARANVKAVKYMSGASTANFVYDAPYTNQTVYNNDFFIVKVTAEDGMTFIYYKIVVTVPGM
jgi:methionine-rich copper-binding protein CopC